MLKQTILIAGLLGVSLFVKAQQVKYKDLIFTDVTVTKNLSYSPSDSAKIKKAHLFDLYQPAGDKSTARPLSSTVRFLRISPAN